MKSHNFLLQVENQAAESRYLETPSRYLETIIENKVERAKRNRMSAFRGLISPLSAVLVKKPRSNRLVFPWEIGNRFLGKNRTI